MELCRLGGAKFEKSEDDVYRRTESQTVEVFFRNFGLGTENTSDFRVTLTWTDVENLITEFAALEELKAVRLLQAKQLAEAAMRAGWVSTRAP